MARKLKKVVILPNLACPHTMGLSCALPPIDQGCAEAERDPREPLRRFGASSTRGSHNTAEGAELLQSGKRVIYQLTGSLQQVKQPTATWRETVWLKKPYSSWQCQMTQKGEMTRNCQLGGSGWLSPHPKLATFNSGVVQAYNRLPSEAVGPPYTKV